MDEECSGGSSQSWCSGCRHAAFVGAAFPSPNSRQAFLEGVQAFTSTCPPPLARYSQDMTDPLKVPPSSPVMGGEWLEEVRVGRGRAEGPEGRGFSLPGVSWEPQPAPIQGPWRRCPPGSPRSGNPGWHCATTSLPPSSTRSQTQPGSLPTGGRACTRLRLLPAILSAACV